MKNSKMVIVLYKPKPSKELEIETLVRKHWPLLNEYGLTTSQSSFLSKSQDGTLIEVFEWASEDHARKAHDHPAVAKLWEAMAMVCSFSTLENLPEARKAFSHFESI